MVKYFNNKFNALAIKVVTFRQKYGAAILHDYVIIISNQSEKHVSFDRSHEPADKLGNYDNDHTLAKLVCLRLKSRLSCN